MDHEALMRIVLEYQIDVPVNGLLVEETPAGKRYFLLLYGGRRIELPGAEYLALLGALPPTPSPALTPAPPPAPPLIKSRSGEGGKEAIVSTGSKRKKK